MLSALPKLCRPGHGLPERALPGSRLLRLRCRPQPRKPAHVLSDSGALLESLRSDARQRLQRVRRASAAAAAAGGRMHGVRPQSSHLADALMDAGGQPCCVVVDAQVAQHHAPSILAMAAGCRRAAVRRLRAVASRANQERSRSAALVLCERARPRSEARARRSGRTARCRAAGERAWRRGSPAHAGAFRRRRCAYRAMAGDAARASSPLAPSHGRSHERRRGGGTCASTRLGSHNDALRCPGLAPAPRLCRRGRHAVQGTADLEHL